MYEQSHSKCNHPGTFLKNVQGSAAKSLALRISQKVWSEA